MKRNLLFGLLISINSVLFAQNPVADFNYTNVCLGSPTSFIDLTTNTPTTWDWAFGDGGISTVQNPTYTYSNPGSYNATLIVYNGAGYDTITKIVNVFPNPSVNAGASQTICLGSATTLSASGGTTYNWSPTTGLSSPTVPNPSASPTTTTTYTVTVTDINGCSANDMVNITVNPLPIVNYTSHIKCEDSGGFATVNLTSMDNYISGGQNTVNWYLDGSYTTAIPNPTAFNTDSTIVYTQIIDVNGCVNSNIVEVNIPINDISVSPMPVDLTCHGVCDGSITLTPAGGNPPYNYNWTPGGMTTQNLNNLCAGTYTYTIIDANACIQFDDVVINEPLPSSIINGVIYFQTVPVTAGIAQLIRKDGNLPSDMTVIDLTAVNPANGEFIFDEVPIGNYIIKALGDTSIYNCAPTYSVGTAQWQLAQVYNIANSCNDSIYVDIDLIELPNLSGLGTINGRLIESGGPLLKAPGEPIPDIDITVDQSPGGGIMSATTTDIDGYFTFTDLPMGTYIIRADMFGYGMDTLQTITFNGTNNNYDVTLCSNDTINIVDMCNMTITGVNEVVTNSLCNIYPNPAKDFLNISKNSVGNIKIEITDLTGKIIFTDALQNNFETIDISSFKKGIYIVTLSNPNVKYIQKLVIN